MTIEERLAESIDADIDLRTMKIDGYDVRYAVAGSGPPLLLIHGANFGWGVWYPNISEFAKCYTVYAIDLPGAGRSTRIDYATADPERDFLRITEKFTTRLGLASFIVVGCSIGGWVALQLALRHPKRVERVIVENTIGFADYISPSDRVIGCYPFARLIAKLFLRPGGRNIEKFLRGILYNHSLELRREFIDYFYETMATSNNLLFISRMNALHRKLTLERDLSRISSEVLVVWGEEDTIMPLRKNRGNFKLIPKVDVRLIKKAGHIPSLEAPCEFNKLALDFLRDGISTTANL